jgi:anti-sigma B factor antagonist
MKIDIEKANGWTVLHMDGALVAATASGAQSRLLDCLKNGGGSFLLDLERVHAIDSAGLAALVRFYKEIRTRGGTMALCALQNDARAIFHLTRLDTIFTILPDSSGTAKAA